MGEASRIRTLVPGLAVLVTVAAISRVTVGPIPGVSPLIVAIGIGALVANVSGVPDWARPGLERHKLLLETGIVLLGARLTLGELIDTGPTVLLLAVVVVALGILYVEALASRVFAVSQQTGSLLAAGTSVCGVSAVLAVAGSIDVDEVDVTYAVATILLFDALTLVIFPPLAPLLGLTGKQFGVWAGLSLFSTGPVAAVGFAVSESAGRWATVTKLVRNAFIGLVAIGYAARYAAATADTVDVRQIWGRFPKFLLGFLGVALLANLVGLSPTTIQSLDTTGDWLFTLAFAGLGFDINLGRLRETGIRPVALVLVHLVTVSVLTLAAVLVLL